MSPTEEALGILKKTDGGGYSGESRRKCGCRRCKAQAESLRQKDRAAATAFVIRHHNEQTGDGLLIFIVV